MIVQHYKRRARAAVAAVAAVALAYFGQTQFLRAGDLLDGVLIFALAGFLLLRAARDAEKLPEPPLSRGQSLALMTIILLIGAGVRFWDLASIPQGVWFDEAENGLVATRILTDPAFRPIYISDLTQLPALFFYYLAWWISVVGSNILAVRLASAALGVLTIAGLYQLGREMFGERVGLIAAFLLSLGRWHLNFSRFGMNGIAAPFFLVFSLVFLARGFRTGRTRDFVLGGLAIGLGLNTYFAFNAAPALIAIWIIHLLVRGRIAFLRRYWQGLAVAVLVAFAAFLPLGAFALENRAAFLERTQTASLFTGKSPAEARAALVANVVQHLEMFNFRGDRNGRHNLAGAPELDDGTAALFVLGIVLALANWRQPRYLLLFLWLVIMLLPGVLSLDFEAPQSYRSIGVVPVTSLLAALPIAYATRIAGGWLGRASWRALQPIGAAGLILIGYGNFHTYWFQQIWDNPSWAEFSTQPTLIAREVNALGPGYAIYIDPVFVGVPTIQFVSPQLKEQDQHAFDPGVDLPFRASSDVAIFVGNDNLPWMEAVRRDYPEATFQAFAASRNASPILYAAIIPKQQVEGVQGLIAQYSAGPPGDAKPAFNRQDKAPTADFRQTAPLPFPFTVTWSSTLAAPTFGSYVFQLDGPPDALLKLDETELVRGGQQKSIRLAQGTHALEIQAPFASPAALQLSWQPPGGLMQVVPSNVLFVPPIKSRGLQASYFANPGWSGQAEIQRNEPDVSKHFHLLPLQQPFTIRWDGKIDIPTAGLYRFGTQSIDYSWLSIDGKELVNNSRELDRYAEGAVNLSEGLHDVQIRFLDQTGHSFIDVYWTPPGGQRAYLPGDRLFPPQGAYPERAGPLRPTQPVAIITSAAPSAAAPAAPANVPGPAPSVAEGEAATGTLPASSLALRQTIGEPGDGPNQLKDSRDAVADASGNVYVVDSGHKDVKKYDASGKYLATIGGPGEGDGQFTEPVAAAIDPAGNLMVLDSETGWIQRFGPDGTFSGKFGRTTGGFYHPRDLFVDSAGNSYVADAGTSHITIFSPTGDLVKKLGQHGNQPGQLMEPVGVAVSAQGVMYVTDTNLYRVTRFDANFQPLQTWGIPKSSSVEGAHVAFASDGGFYVTDPDGHRVLHFDASGKAVDQLGTADQLQHPVGISVDAKGNVFVADAGAGRVLVFGS